MRYLALFLLLAIGGCGLFEPELDRDAFLQQQQQAGFILIGEFGKQWPAKRVDEIEAENEIRFTRRNGTPHHYRGFYPYNLKVVFLESSGGSETIMVMRSEYPRM